MTALLAGGLSAQPDHLPAALPEDLLPQLKTLLETAVNKSPTSLSRQLELAQTEAAYMIDRAALFPSLSANGSYTKGESSVEGGIPTEYDGVGYGVNLGQPIFYWGALKYQRDISKLYVKISEKQYAEAYRSLALTLRSQYLALIQKKITVRNYRFSQRMAESNLSVQEAQLREGRISPGDVINPRLAVDEAKIYAERAEADYEQSRRLLAITAGVPEITDEMVPAEMPKPAYAAETIGAYFDSQKSTLLENNILLGVYDQQIRQADLRYKIARVRLLPKVSFNANYNYGNQSNVSLDPTGRPVVVASATTSSAWGISAFWPIFDGLATRGAKLSALATKRLAQQNLESYRRSTSEQLRMLERQIGFSGRLMDLTETRLALAQAGVRKVGDDVKSGVTPQATLDIFIQSANRAELEAMSARADFLSRWAEYVSILGVDPVLNNLPSRYFRNGK